MERVTVNQAFLLYNGLLVLHWQVKNALWISVQGKWVGCQNNRMMIYPANSTTTLTIHVQGLMGRYHRQFVVHPVGNLVVPEPLHGSWVTPVSVNVQQISLPFLRKDRFIRSWTFTPVIPSAEIIIPEFQTDNDYDKRLLHHS